MARSEKTLTPQVNQKFACYQLRVARSAIHRWGVFAQEVIPRNRKVLEYTGEKISRRESKRRADSREDVYLFTLDNYWNIDGAVGGSGAELVNHCCDPNLVVRILKGHIIYLSQREIAAGEELTIDYRFGWDVEKVPCKCGSPKCRGVINVKE